MDSWIDCSVCGKRYGASLPSCPMCGVPNNFVVPAPPKKSAAGKVAGGAIVVVIAVALFLVVPALMGTMGQQTDNPVIRILQPQGLEPVTVPRDELVQHALDKINKDRADFGLPPVELSSNQAAQAHAEDVFQTKQISHWMTNGEKPYMTYTRYGGEGSVQQNVAIAGFSAAQYQECKTSILVDCERIEPLSTIEELEYEMMYKDKECCNDGHRDNILDPRHTHVSIGIVYDEYYLALVQNFENNYGLDVFVNNGQVRITGELPEGELEQVSIYYDEMPDEEIYEQNKQRLSYSTGELVAIAVKPLPPGYYYETPEGYSLIEANRWGEGDSVDIMFDLAPSVEQDGVYTLFAVVKDGEETLDATSYAVFVDSDS
jgi:uncharacterized protein YkwD